MTIRQLAEEVLLLTGSKSEIIHAPGRVGDIRHSQAGSDKLRAAGWIPSHDLVEGLKKTVDYFLNR
jgi:nucleoside-diphosphate-sugar epimerase